MFIRIFFKALLITVTFLIISPTLVQSTALKRSISMPNLFGILPSEVSGPSVLKRHLSIHYPLPHLTPINALPAEENKSSQKSDIELSPSLILPPCLIGNKKEGFLIPYRNYLGKKHIVIPKVEDFKLGHYPLHRERHFRLGTGEHFTDDYGNTVRISKNGTVKYRDKHRLIEIDTNSLWPMNKIFYYDPKNPTGLKQQDVLGIDSFSRLTPSPDSGIKSKNFPIIFPGINSRIFFEPSQPSHWDISKLPQSPPQILSNCGSVCAAHLLTKFFDTEVESSDFSETGLRPSELAGRIEKFLSQRDLGHIQVIFRKGKDGQRLEQLLRQGAPFIATVKWDEETYHSVVVSGFNPSNQTLLVYNPHGYYWKPMPLENFFHFWYGDTLELSKR